MIVQKLMAAPHLNSQIVTNARSLLSELNGRQLGDMLSLLSKHSVFCLETLMAVTKILQSENSYISDQAYKYLVMSNTSDEAIVELMEKHKRSR